MSNPTISRNDVTKELTEQVFGKKSKNNSGKKFFAPVLTEAGWDNDVNWLGRETIINGMNKILRTIFADIYLDNIDPKTGQVNQTAWEADAADFTAGVAKLSDLEDQIDDLQALQQSYTVDNDNFGATDPDGSPTAEATRLLGLVRENNAKIKVLRAQREQIQSKYADRAAKRKEREAAKEAAGQTVATAGV